MFYKQLVSQTGAPPNDISPGAAPAGSSPGGLPASLVFPKAPQVISLGNQD